MSIIVQEVTRFYGVQKALDSVSFEVKTGEIAAFLGPNGAGKSTMMKIITGFIPATLGKVFVNGIETDTNNLEVRKQIGYLPENNPLYHEMYVREYLSFVASFYENVRKDSKRIDRTIEITGLGPEQNKRIGSLSKGYRQRVGLAQALIHDPDVLILDEPTTGLDPNQIIEIRNLIRETGKEKTVLLSTHLMQEAEAICDRVIIIDKGIIVANELKEKIYSYLKNPRQVVEVEFDKDPSENSLMSIAGVALVRKIKDRIYIIEASGDTDMRPSIFNFAVAQGYTVLSQRQHANSLEEIFRQLTT